MAEDLELIRKFPWLGHTSQVTEEILNTLFEKEKHYAGSWQKRGGPGAFMMLARKWDRIENIASVNGYDIFKMLEQNMGDVEDDVKDLIGYLVLCLANERSNRRDALDKRSAQIVSEIAGGK